MTSLGYSEDAKVLKRSLSDSLRSYLYAAEDHLTVAPLCGRRLDGPIRLYAHPSSPLEITYKYDRAADEILVLNIARVMIRLHVFVSYSHNDRVWLDAIREKLRLLTSFGVRFWADTDLRPGEDWFQVLQKNLRDARGALLLVSDSFLTSDFIREAELPTILEADSGEFKFFWVAVEDYGAESEPADHTREARLKMRRAIESHQAVINPSPPLSAMDEVNRLKALDAIQAEIVDELAP